MAPGVEQLLPQDANAEWVNSNQVFPDFLKSRSWARNRPWTHRKEISSKTQVNSQALMSPNIVSILITLLAQPSFFIDEYMNGSWLVRPLKTTAYLRLVKCSY